MAKKKKKQPAKKRNRGTLLTDFNNRDIPIEEVIDECEEIFKKNLIDGEIVSYNREICKIQYIERNEEKEITCRIDNHFLSFIKNIKFTKRFIRRDNKDIVENIYYANSDIQRKFGNLEIENLNLKINKFLFWEVKKKNELKATFYDNYCTKFNSKFYYQKIDKLPLKKELLELDNSWKLSIGFGSTSVYETSITLHYIYGVPYIPASAIKGAFRSYIIQEYFFDKLEQYDNYNDFEQNELFTKDKNSKKYKYQWFVDIFGSENNQGNIIFFDAFSDNIKIEKDIMTPHYSDYYGDKKNKIAPKDTIKPIPIPFLTINGKFKFLVGVKNDNKIKIKDEEFDILKFVKNNLKKSLTEFGIGAKTSVGYGYFKE
jgi:CRISPR-associated protein Cmr6